MQNNFREFEELVFFDLWIPDSGFRIPDSGFRIPDSGFWFPVSGFRFPDSSFRVARSSDHPELGGKKCWAGGVAECSLCCCDKPCGTLWVSS